MMLKESIKRLNFYPKPLIEDMNKKISCKDLHKIISLLVHDSKVFFF